MLGTHDAPALHAHALQLLALLAGGTEGQNPFVRCLRELTALELAQLLSAVNRGLQPPRHLAAAPADAAEAATALAYLARCHGCASAMPGTWTTPERMPAL